VLRGIFGPKREELACGCKKLVIEELTTSPNIVMVSQSRNIWPCHGLGC
jgi:hypothetical protein